MAGPGGEVVVPADGRAPEVLRSLHRGTPVGEVVTVRVKGRDRTGWAARHLADCLVGAGFVDVVADGGPGGVGSATAVRARSLADTVRPGLVLLCVGLNPSLAAADAGIAYVTATNRFWAAAHAAGLVPVVRDPGAALAAGVGLTDLVKRATPRAHHLDPDEYRGGVARVERLVRWLRPAAVAFVGLSGYRAAVDPAAVVGPQPAGFGGRPAYVLPSTSGANAHARLDDLVGHLQAAAAPAAGAGRRGQRPHAHPTPGSGAGDRHLGSRAGPAQ